MSNDSKAPAWGQVSAINGDGARGALDSTYKITVPPAKQGENGKIETGVSSQKAQKPFNIEGKKSRSTVAERYYLQAHLRRLVPADRAATCCRHIIPGKDFVDIRKLRDQARAYFGNVMRCERVWICPVCAARISEERRRELSEALRQSGYVAVLATFTLSHFSGQPLKQSLAMLKRAYDKFTSGRAMQALKTKHEVAGYITATEVTHGANGWHPHLHVLLFLDWGGDVSLLPQSEYHRYFDDRIGKLNLDFWLRWRDMVTVLGGKVSEAAFDVRGANDDVADYVAKFGRLPSEVRPSSITWGPADELTKAVVKRGRGESRSPFQLLADFADGDEQAGALFQEYARAMRGKRQLRWSKGLRDLLGIGAERDLADLITDDEILSDSLAQLDYRQWQVVMQNKASGRLVEIASTGDIRAMFDFLDGLPGMNDCSPHYDHSIRRNARKRGNKCAF